MSWFQTIGGIAAILLGLNVLFVVWREVRHRQKLRRSEEYRQYWWDLENKN